MTNAVFHWLFSSGNGRIWCYGLSRK